MKALKSLLHLPFSLLAISEQADIMVDENSPLLSESAKGPVSGKQSFAVNVSDEGQNAEREWDGSLWKMCGDCDQAGLSTFAYVKMCTPFAFGYVRVFVLLECVEALFKYFAAAITEQILSLLGVKSFFFFAYRHNLQRALGKGFWVHAVIFTLLFCTWGYALMGSSSRVNEACGIHHPPGHFPGLHSTTCHC